MNPRRKDTGKYEVRWREGNRNRSRSFDRKKDADDFKAQLRINKQRRGLVTIDAKGATVADLGVMVWENRWSKLGDKTRANYALAWDVHVVRRIGDRQIDMLTFFDIEQWLTVMHKDGVGQESQRRALKLLKFALKCAVQWHMLPVSPAEYAPTPDAPTRTPIYPPSPETAEALRSELLRAGRPIDALRVSMMYAQGLRVGETSRVAWDDFKARTVLVFDNKRKTFRPVDLEPVIAKEIAEVRLAARSTKGRVFPGDGNNWRNRVYNPAVDEAKIKIGPPKDLRHTRVSMLLIAGESIPHIAEQIGHSPEMTVGNYTHMIAELRGHERVPANDLIVRARYAKKTNRKAGNQ